MKDKFTDLNAHLFAQLERLGDEDLTPEQVELEIGRAKAISGVADRVIHSAALVLKAQKAFHEGEVGTAHPMLAIEGSK